MNSNFTVGPYRRRKIIKTEDYIGVNLIFDNPSIDAFSIKPCDAGKRIDVRINFNGETKDFTIEEFAEKLGFKEIDSE